MKPEHVKKSKTLQYLADGQDYPLERSSGWVQYGMWLVRPRVVREFRGHATQLPPVEPYWMETVKAVDRVYEHPVLTDFWRHGALVANTSHEHPYQSNLPERYRKISRWYSLDTNLDQPRPWNLKTKIPVFSLALVQGEKPTRRWLLYAHSPLQNRKGVRISIPNYQQVVVNVSREGTFCLIDERSGTTEQIEGP